MAYKLGNINVLDTKPSTAIGVSIPFSNTTAFTSVYTTAEQLKYNIINYLVTDKRERLFFPNFGSGLRSRLFEQITEENMMALEEVIKQDLALYFPTADITDVKIIPGSNNGDSIQGNYFTLSLNYVMKTTGKSDVITINYAANS